MLISIIIVTYNSISLIEDCLRSIYQYNDLSDDQIEIIIVDNGGEKGYHEIKNFISEKFGENIKIFQNENHGYGHGNNVGIRQAKGEIIAIMNPDVRLTKSLFKKTLQHFEKENLGMLGYSQKGGLNYSYFVKPEYFIPLFSSVFIKFMNKFHVFFDQYFYLSGAFIFFRRKDFIKIGMFDEKMFMYFEEPDISNRLQSIGKNSLYDSSVSYIHLMEQKEDYNNFLLDEGSKSLKLYFEKHGFNQKNYLKKRFLELNVMKYLYKILGKEKSVEKINAYIKSLNKVFNNGERKF